MQAAAVSLPLRNSTWRLAMLGVTRRFVHGAELARGGISSRTLILVLEGAAVMSVLSPDGGEAVVAVLGPGQACGGPAEPQFDDVVVLRALGPVRASLVPGDGLLAVANDDARLALALARIAAVRAAVVAETAVCLRTREAPERVSWWLGRIASEHGIATADGRRIELPITQSHLASMAACARETVNRAVASLVAAGELRIEHGQYVVRDTGWRPRAASG